MNYVIFLSVLFCSADIVSSLNKENKIPSPRKVYSSQTVMTLYCLNNNVQRYYQDVNILACQSIDHIIYDAQRSKRQSPTKQLMQKNITGSLDTNDKKQDQASLLEQAFRECQIIDEAMKKAKLKRVVRECHIIDAAEKKIEEQKNGVTFYKGQSIRKNASVLKGLNEISRDCDPRAAYSLPKSNDSRAFQALSEDEIEDSILA